MFINSFQSEWIKRRRSAAAWLTVIGGLFIPTIITSSRLIYHSKTILSNSSDGVWNSLFNQSWQFMTILLLPMGIILAASLISQIEYRNNAWKQLHTTPQSLSLIFWAKFSVVVVMLLQFFMLFNIGIYFEGVVPAIFCSSVPFPQQDFPFLFFLRNNATFFLLCLPVLSLQYLLSIHIKNFMIPIGIGITLMIASMISLSWKYGYVLPYSYSSLQYLANDNRTDPTVNINLWAAGYFIFFMLLNYLLYIYKTQKPQFNIFQKRRVVAIILVIVILAIAGLMLLPRNTPRLQTSLTTEQRIKSVEDNIGFVKFKITGRVATHIEERMKYYGINGLSMAVINDYKIDWVKNYGWANVEDKIPITDATLFQPGSISKSVNALGIMKLYQDKEVDLFKDVNSYLTSWKFPYDSLSKGKKITLAQLLSHSAGLNVHGFGFESYARGDTLPTIVQLLDGKKPSTTETVRSLFEPGWKHKYSGGGTMISQLALMDVAKQPYDSFMDQEILQPFGMKNSFFTQPPPIDKENFLAIGYTQIKSGGRVRGNYPITPQQAAAGLWTTSTDLANMVVTIQRTLAGKPATFLRRETAELMLTPYNDISATLGFFIDDKNGTAYFQHGAGNPGFSGWYYGGMEGGKGVVILMNSDVGTRIFDEIIKSVAQVYGWEGFAPPEKAIEKTTVQPSDSILKKYIGAYQLGSSIIIVNQKNGSLWINSQEKSWKMHFTNDSSFFNLESKTERKFTRKEGKVNTLVIVSDNGTVRKARAVSPITISEKQMQLYIGDYKELGGETATILMKDGYLWVKSENFIAPMRLHFLSATSFYLEENGGMFTFEFDKNGRVETVQAMAGENTRTILTKKK